MRPPIETPAREEDRRARIFLVAFVLAILTACLAAIGWNAEADPIDPTDASVREVSFEWSGDTLDREQQIEIFLRERFINKRELRKALVLVPFVVETCERRNFNPALMAAIITMESNWDPRAISHRGAIGLTQILNASVRWTDALDPAEQVDKGIDVLMKCWEKCGTAEGALAYYATGKTCTGWSHGARLRIRLAAHIEAL